ncbi:DUF262 domain-containing protein [Lysinibacillus sp. 1P01SD]|uniref:DUF262 domain-containing protein n=1 Tax=Lysinibacillus sp. 1P01SD TaxID=3132285 RepID=UPI0039A3D203
MKVEFKNLSWSLKQIVRMIDNGKIELEFPIQRKSEAWTLKGRSLLIFSTINEYPIPPVYFVSKKVTEDQLAKNKEKRASEDFKDIAELKSQDVVRYLIDGLQRFSTFYSYIKNEWALVADTPNVEVEGNEYVIAGKTFSELDEVCQDMILSRSILSYTVDGEVTDYRIIDQIFLLMNNGVALKNDQKIKPTLGSNIAPLLEKFDTHRFILLSSFSKAQILGDSHISALLQHLMLEECLNDSEERVKDFSIGEILNFATLFGSFDNQSKTDTLAELTNVLDYGEKVLEAGEFTKKVKFLKRVNFPMVVSVFAKAQVNDIDPKVTAEWFKKFIADTTDSNHAYQARQGEGTTKFGSFVHRYNVMAMDFNSFLQSKDISLTVEAIQKIEIAKTSDVVESKANEAVDDKAKPNVVVEATSSIITTDEATKSNDGVVEKTNEIPPFKIEEKIKVEANTVNNPLTEIVSDYLVKGKKLQFLAQKYVEEMLEPTLSENPTANEISFKIEEDIGNGVATFGISMELISAGIPMTEKTLAYISAMGNDGEIIKSALESFKKEINMIVKEIESVTTEYVMHVEDTNSVAESGILVGVK